MASWCVGWVWLVEKGFSGSDLVLSAVFYPPVSFLAGSHDHDRVLRDTEATRPREACALNPELLLAFPTPSCGRRKILVVFTPVSSSSGTIRIIRGRGRFGLNSSRDKPKEGGKESKQWEYAVLPFRESFMRTSEKQRLGVEDASKIYMAKMEMVGSRTLYWE